MKATTTPTQHANTRVLDLILTAMMIALVFVATLLLNIRLPLAVNGGGLIHLGSAMLFIIAILFGPKKGAMAGAFGMGLFDLVSGFAIWAPISFLARGLQGYIVGKIAWSKGRNGNSLVWNAIAVLISIPPMVAGYYIWEVILFHNWRIPLASIPGDLIQSAVGLLVALPVCVVLKKIPLFNK